MFVYRGHRMNQAQCDCMTIVLNEQMQGKHRGMKKLNEAFERTCKEKGCKIPEEVGPLGPDPVRKRSR